MLRVGGGGGGGGGSRIGFTYIYFDLGLTFSG